MNGDMRTVYCTDALPWLAARKGGLHAIVTGLPDAAELDDMALPDYEVWFNEAATLLVEAVTPTGGLVVCHTDRKHAGRWYDKSAAMHKAATRHGLLAIWHKIVLRRGVGKSDLHRPTYSHLQAFAALAKPGTTTPDVIDRGRVVYPNGMGVDATIVAVEWVRKFGDPIVDPFCGHGTVLAVANSLGLHAIGVDIDPGCCALSRALDLDAQLVLA